MDARSSARGLGIYHQWVSACPTGLASWSGGCQQRHAVQRIWLSSLQRAVQACQLLALVGVEKHPALAVTRTDSGRLNRPPKRIVRKLLLGVMYQCDLDTLYTDTRAARRVNSQAARAAGHKAAALMPRIQRRPTPSLWHEVLALSVMEHFLTRAKEGMIYSCAPEAVRFSTLDAILQVPSTKRARHDVDDEELEVEQLGSDHPRASVLFFQVVTLKPNKRTLTLPVAAGGRVPFQSAVIMMRPVLQTISEDKVVLGDIIDAAAQHLTHVIESVHAASSASRGIWQWQAEDLVWHFPNSLSQEGMTRLLGRLVKGEAFPEAENRVAEDALSDSELDAVRQLEGEGLVRLHRQHGRPMYSLSQDGMAQLVCSTLVSKPQDLFALQPDTPIEACTVYELLERMRADGWEWRPRMSDMQRRRQNLPKQPAGVLENGHAVMRSG